MRTVVVVAAIVSAMVGAYAAGYADGNADAADRALDRRPAVVAITTPDGVLRGFTVTGVDRPDRFRAAGEWVIAVGDPAGGPDRVIYCLPTD